MSPIELAAVVVAAILGGAAQSILGFGVAFTTVPVLAVVAPELLPGAALAGFLPMTLVMASREVQHLRRDDALRLCLARVPGILLGTAAVVVLSARSLAAAVAVILLLAVGASARGWALAPTPRTLNVAGVVSGFSGTATGLGGPPLALVYRGEASAVMRPTLAVVFAVGIVMSLGTLAASGSLDGDHLRAGVWIGGGTIVGLVAASPLLERLAEATLRAVLLWWAGAGAVLALGRVVLG